MISLEKLLALKNGFGKGQQASCVYIFQVQSHLET